MQSFPSLIVFDLDFTLWDAGGLWCDCLAYPFRCDDGKVFDTQRREVSLYSDVRHILNTIDQWDIEIGLASRTEKPNWARELLHLLRIDQRFAYQEIYPSSKIHHFKRLKESSGADFQEMLFFDDEFRNIEEVGSLGVTAMHVRSGMNQVIFDEGISQFQK